MFHNICAGTDDVAFKVSGDDAVIADKRERLYNDLSIIAAVGQCLEIPRHAGGEHHLGGHLPFGAETLAPKCFSVL